MTKFKYNPGEFLGPYNVLFLERDSNNTQKGYFKCVECGEQFYTTVRYVVRGDRRFCDVCSKKNKAKIGQKFANDEKRKEAARHAVEKIKPGQIYGHLTVLERTEKIKNGRRIWKCQCDCENKTIVEVRSDSLLSGHTQSCGCLGSLGEQKISQLLCQLGYSFTTQFSFDDCRSPKNYPLRFDFYLPEHNCCIEYDGEQHFKDTSGWFNNYSFQELQKRDNIKNQYCQVNNIKLIRIPYTDYKKINLNYLKELING